MKLLNKDLLANTYKIEDLIDNIYGVSLLQILKTQKLTPEFCVDYLLNEDFQLLEEEQYISAQLILKYQPHISFIDLLELMMLNGDNKKSNLFNFDKYLD